MRCRIQAFSTQSRLRRPRSLAALIIVCFISTSAAAVTLPEIRALAADQHYAEALKQLDAYLVENGDDVEARLFRGVILTRQGNIDEAIDAFDELAKARPELPEPLNNLAVLYAAQGRYEDSRKVLLRAIELEPRYDTAHENLGDVYAKLANIAYERAYTLDQKNTAARDKASWMTRVLDTEHAQAAKTAREVGASSPDTETKALEQIEPRATSEAEIAAIHKQIAETCYAVNGIESYPAARSVVSWFSDRGVAAAEQTRAVEESIFYEVYVPPLENREAAGEELRRMREDGFVDIMRINSGELQNGISVGAYRELANAERRVKTFRAKGYAVEFRPRDRSRRTYWVAVNAGTSRELRNEFTSAFPAYPLSESTCR
ncbi:MAG: tetratricopeptide repeat protein [Gammaproteobacteria bacterium]|nr:tetratricopeptide repeat protein [Gammaproteobacteria bacterium]NIM72986.1 tetratricopeptide repeat protein [Gammaproteobacteria bacterium]NIN38602.1 tetratricopeptide repeat protein [Gammaproteobacteria bacterium]NIO24738.1 tetratricopeptide repeat protein [Gammaproteobacteria bacterium]NIO65341.1 tetratricopeptide repeat protein [Gammaproteobacteria bacterium]